MGNGAKNGAQSEWGKSRKVLSQEGESGEGGNVNWKQDAATAAAATTNGDYFVAKQGQINVLS